ncbi:PREDICTED: matrix Gla protein-like isoform X1 [Gekko japonicus]|uniref:Matrix Gla protein n=1 Tax=Gekko japonicus TaxID=146911 RepID=A0ABM1KSW9_GEKJA|nr:PREDICTED: matrix Gla protein-like isoform X1 [Gekko japonicus]
MGNLLMLLLLTLVFTAPCCCEGDTNRPLDEGIKINKKTAEAFVRRQKRSYPYYERYYETFKSPMEMKHEQCENYAPCDYYSEIIGFQAAYSLVFGRT